MQTLADAEKMQAWSREQKRSGARIGFVPTMGFLHEGHLQLVDAAKAHSDRVVLSIFVNPTQFAPGEDLDRYPRDLERDLRLAAERGVDLCFTPSVEAIYPEGDQTSVVVTELTRGLCGPFRPGHFRGVATVVAKLFNLVDPDVAVFGEKDFQQLRILERMVRDLKFPLEILAVPTHREADGLAMSSRNVYLSPEDRQEALLRLATGGQGYHDRRGATPGGISGGGGRSRPETGGTGGETRPHSDRCLLESNPPH